VDIELKPFERSDFARLVEWSTSPEFLLQWAGSLFKYPLDEAQLEEHVRGAKGDEPTRKIFKVVDKASHAAIGHIELGNINPRNRSAGIMHALIGDPALRGQGIGAQMIRRVLEIGFDELGLHRIDLRVFDFNRAAIACYEKVGFVREGRYREVTRINDEYWSIYVMSILEWEWRSRGLRKD
jgi:RimJ/RimL family protein N-acetyltransferase